MPQNLTVNQLALDALILIGEYAPNETPEEGQIPEAIRVINYILDNFADDGLFIPFFNTLHFNLQANQQEYTISTLGTSDITAPMIAAALTCKVTDGSMEWPCEIIQYSEPDYLPRVLGQTFRPEYVIVQRENQQTRLIFYNTPDRIYPAFIRYKPYLDNLETNQPLINVPPSYHRFLLYKSAKELSMRYPTSNWEKKHEDELMAMEERIKASNDSVMTVNTSGILQGPFWCGYDDFLGGVIIG